MVDPERSAAAKKGHEVQNVYEMEDVAFPIGEIIEEFSQKYRLTDSMQRFLLWRLKFATDSKTARAVGVGVETVRRWKATSRPDLPDRTHDFKIAYDELFRRNRQIAEKAMALLGVRTVEVAEELLNATKKTLVAKEGGEVEVFESPDYENRYRGAQVVSNWMGEWGAKPPQQSSPVYVTVLANFQELIEAKKRAIAGGQHVIDAPAVSVEEDISVR